MCVHDECVSMCALVSTWVSKDSIVELTLPPIHRWAMEIEVKIVRPGDRHLYLGGHLDTQIRQFLVSLALFLLDLKLRALVPWEFVKG